MILSGPEFLGFGVLNRLILKVMPQKQYRKALEKYMPAWALRFMGQTEQGMQAMLRRIPDHISLESVRATWAAGLYLYRTDFWVQPNAKVACWYGEKEGHMKNAIQRLRTAYPSLIVHCFPGFGHGDIGAFLMTANAGSQSRSLMARRSISRCRRAVWGWMWAAAAAR